MDDRYKKRGLKFNNTSDSRALRAVHNQQRQRERRDDVVSSRRQIVDIQDSPKVTDPLKLKRDVDKQAELRQKGLERYQKLLKWKEMKKKQLEKEKKRRMPSFKTGIYHPSPPRFLVSENQNENGTTPHASLKKKTMTPGASLRKVRVFHLGGTPATSLLRVPQFHTGVTPRVSTKSQAPMVKKHKEQENLGPSLRTHGALKNGRRARGKGGSARDCTSRPRKFDDQEDLGIKPLPLTPQVTSQSKVEKPMLPSETLPSFAPADFSFNFEVPQTSETKRTEHLSTDYTDDPFPSQVLEVSLDHINAKKEDMEIGKDPPKEQKHSFLQKNYDGDTSETGDKETQSLHEKNLFPQEGNVGCTSDIAESEKSPHEDAFGSDISTTSKNDMQPDSATLSDELTGDSMHYENLEPGSHLELLNNERIGGDPVTGEQIRGRCDQEKPEDTESNVSDMNTSTLEVQGADDSRPKRSRATTPAKRLSRRSASCCFDGTVTPILSRLRPRTPCSRSTRRSLSAHCDMPHELYTPRRQSARKTPRRSVSKATKCQAPYDVHIVSPAPMSFDGGIIAAESLAQDTMDRMVDAANKSLPQLHLQNTPSGITLNAPSQKESSSPLLTPENLFRKEQGMWTVETSPWITSQRSKKKQRAASGLQGMFDDVPTGGSPVPHPVIPSASVSFGTSSSVSKETVCTNLLSLLQPSSSQNTESPEVNVWGEESPAINAQGSPNTSRQRQSSGKKTPPEKMNQVPAEMQTDYAVVSPSGNDPIASKLPPSADILPLFQNEKNREDRSEKQKSRKSVMFAISEQENLKPDTYKLPGTPIRTSSRVSMGLFAKVDPSVSGLVTPDQDLIAFDSPMSEKKISRTSRRKSCRVSLLPGMTLSPTKEEAAPIPTDLITWDSPAETKRASGRVAPSMATPVRRSRRLSKIM